MEEVQMVPFAAYESLSSRFGRIIKWLVMGWAISVVALGLVIVMSLSYTEQAVEEVVTETTETVTQDSGDGGNNHYIGGDLNGNANYNEDSQDNQD